MKLQLPLTPSTLRDIVETYSDDPVGFARVICGVEGLDSWQEWYLKESQTHGKDPVSLAIASCTGSGKTYLSCIIALHKLLCYPEALVIITSATKNQLKSAFGSTLQKVINNSCLKDWFDVAAEKVTIKGVTNASILLQAWSKNTPESFAGQHPVESKYGVVCLIADEASSIDPVIFQAWDGNMSHPNSCLILLGNPLYRHGELFDAFHKNSTVFKTAAVSALDSSFISEKWIEKMKVKYGEDSDMYKVRVLGQFPLSDFDSFIPAKTLEGAVGREVGDQSLQPVVAGLDVGAYRDASVLAIRQGRKLLAMLEWETDDTMIVAEEVSKAILKYNIERCVVDGNGVGKGVYDRLRITDKDIIFNVSFIQYGPKINQEYNNTRTRFWGLAKQWLATGSILNDRGLIDEGSSLLSTYDIHMRYCLETKKEALKHTNSPDRFDAFAYSFGCGNMLRSQVTPRKAKRIQVHI